MCYRVYIKPSDIILSHGTVVIFRLFTCALCINTHTYMLHGTKKNPC